MRDDDTKMHTKPNTDKIIEAVMREWVITDCERIDEKFAAMAKSFATGNDYTIYINPSQSEIREMIRESQYKGDKIRGFVDKAGLGNLYLFSADVNHQDGIKALTNEKTVRLQGEILDIYYDYKKKIILFSKFTEAIQSMYDYEADTDQYVKGSDEYYREPWKNAEKKIESFWGKNIMRNKNIRNIGAKGFDSDLTKGM